MFLKIVTIFALVKPSMPPWYKIREGRPRSIPSLVALRKGKTTRGRRIAQESATYAPCRLSGRSEVNCRASRRKKGPTNSNSPSGTTLIVMMPTISQLSSLPATPTN